MPPYSPPTMYRMPDNRAVIIGLCADTLGHGPRSMWQTHFYGRLADLLAGRAPTRNELRLLIQDACTTYADQQAQTIRPVAAPKQRELSRLTEALIALARIRTRPTAARPSRRWPEPAWSPSW